MGSATASSPSAYGRRWFGGREFAWFVALLATALAMGAALAHALELPNKMAMGMDDYLAAQQSYRGWSNLGFVLSIELTGLIALMVIYWRQRPVLWRVLAALICVALAQLVFWTFTFPVNLATGNWTTMPANWAELRLQWEYSHLAGAIFQVLALSFLVLAVLRWAGRTRAVDGRQRGTPPSESVHPSPQL